jgi:dienelactone hydrolase
MNDKAKKQKTLTRIILTVVVVILILVGAFYVYTLDYYRATDDVHQLTASEKQNIEINNKIIVVNPEETNDREIGLIFYPGGKVEAIAYLPLLYQLSQKGITCFLIEMPFNLAVFDINAANSVFEKYPEIKTWFIAGHSLGGAMASSYMKKNYNKVDGLILMGAYPINDAEVATLAIYGSEDVNLDLTKLENTENKIEISGGNHAYFGNYGEQKGDGKATITREEQQEVAVKEIIEFISEETK